MGKPKHDSTLADNSATGNDYIESFVKALLDTRVQAALRDIIKPIFEAATKDITDNLQRQINNITDDYNNSNARITTLESKIEDLETYTRRDNLVIFGLKPTTYSAAAATASGGPLLRSDTRSGPQEHGESHTSAEMDVLNLCNDILGVPLTRSDISVAHRIANRDKRQQQSSIVVRFTNRRSRDSVYMARKKLAQIKMGVYINEHLTTKNQALAQAGRKLLKEKKIQSCWTYHGQVYIKLSGLPDSRPLRVTCVQDLPSG